MVTIHEYVIRGKRHVTVVCSFIKPIISPVAYSFSRRRPITTLISFGERYRPIGTEKQPINFLRVVS